MSITPFFVYACLKVKKFVACYLSQESSNRTHAQT